MITSIYHWHRSIYMGLSVHPNKILFHEISREIQVPDPLSEQNNNKKDLFDLLCLISCILIIIEGSWSLFQAPGSIRTGMPNSCFSIFFCWFVHGLFSSWSLADIDQPSSTSCIDSICIDIFFTLNQHQLSIKLSILLIRDSFSVPHTHLENWKVLTISL